MQPNRRDFLRQVGVLTAAGGGLAVAGTSSAEAAEVDPHAFDDKIAVLVDTTACVGCRLCEYACKKSNGVPNEKLASYEDQGVFRQQRRPNAYELTVVNAHRPAKPDGTAAGAPVYAKINCMHCNHCACGSACIVGALKKQPNGAVTYDESKCIGCRYCMVACPFQLPAYSYDDVLTPKVIKCQFCFQQRTSKGDVPACVAACPKEALIFGKRGDLLKLAHETIAANPGKYVDHVYGEHEAGGTSWLYLAPVPFEQLGLPKVRTAAPPALTEKIQAGLFSPSLGMPPAILAGLLGAAMWWTKPRAKKVESQAVAPEAATSTEPAAHPHSPDDAHAHAHEEHHEEEPRPVAAKLVTPGTLLLLAVTLFGVGCYLFRFLFGFAASTNLNLQRPWGLWIGIDVASGVALAVGGFTSVVLVNILHLEKYRPIVRPALLTAMLGYTVVVVGLLADLGRWYNVWHPLVPTMWSPTSVLWQVGIVEVLCVHLLWIEFAPVFATRLDEVQKRWPRLARFVPLARRGMGVLEKLMPVLLIVGVLANFLHQFALGNLLVIAPDKLHPLWWSPISGLVFLVTAIAVGFPMIIWESLFASWSLKLAPEMHVLKGLARMAWWMLAVAMLLKVADVVARGAHVHLGDGTLESNLWVIETVAGMLVPALMMAGRRVRSSPRLLFVAATLAVAGLIMNRVNVFIVAYHPPFDAGYFPSVAEFGVTAGLFAALMLGYRLVVMYFPVISQPKVAAATAERPAPSGSVPAEPAPAMAPAPAPATAVTAGATA